MNGTQEEWVIILGIITAGIVACKWADVVISRGRAKGKRARREEEEAARAE